jgi:hypothetical protein
MVAAVVALFLIWSMRVIPHDQERTDDRLGDYAPRRYEWWIIGLVGTALAIFLIFLSSSFRDVMRGRGNPESSLTFGEIFKPYVPYTFYMAGLWMGIVLPIFILVIRTIKLDFADWREKRKSLHASVVSGLAGDADKIALRFDGLVAALQQYVLCLKGIGERYVPVVLGVCLMLLYEQLTPSKGTVTPLAVEAGKIAAWLLLGPALFMFITVVAIGYQNAAARAHAGLSALSRSLLEQSGKRDLLDKVLKSQSDLLWNQSPVAFVLTVVKSASVSMPLLLAVTGYLLKQLTGSGGWLGIFVPQAVVDFVRRLYTQ